MAKNSIFDPTKDGVKADNSGYSSNQIDKMIGESAAAVIDDDAAGDDTVYSSAKIYSLLPEDTATGAEVIITDACPDLPIVELQADINAVQEGTGDPSPDNVRPISGWDEITITHDDIDVEISLGDNTVYGGTYNSDGTLTVTYAIIDLGFLTWDLNSDTHRARSYDIKDVVKKPESSSSLSGVIAEEYKIINYGGTLHINELTLYSDGSLIGYYDGVNDPHGNIIYPLATPIELTVGTLSFNTNGEGSTVISCDSGDVTVTYKKLTTLS